jgi:hypothetical protein
MAKKPRDEAERAEMRRLLAADLAEIRAVLAGTSTEWETLDSFADEYPLTGWYDPREYIDGESSSDRVLQLSTGGPGAEGL